MYIGRSKLEKERLVDSATLLPVGASDCWTTSRDLRYASGNATPVEPLPNCQLRPRSRLRKTWRDEGNMRAHAQLESPLVPVSIITQLCREGTLHVLRGF